MNLLLAAVTLLVFYTVKLFYSNLWVPWRTEHHFKRQGIGCPGYCLIFGNSSEIRRATLCGSQVRGKCVRPPWHHGTRGSILWSVVSHVWENILVPVQFHAPIGRNKTDMIKEVPMNTRREYVKVSFNPSCSLDKGLWDLRVINGPFTEGLSIWLFFLRLKWND